MAYWVKNGLERAGAEDWGWGEVWQLPKQKMKRAELGLWDWRGRGSLR